jgi:hypothetical protein
VAAGLFATHILTSSAAATPIATGGALTTTLVTSTTLPTMIPTLLPIAQVGMAVLGTTAVLIPDGIPNYIYVGVRRELMANKIAFSTLLFAEQYASILLATKYCPPGSANDDKSTSNVDDPYAMCRRQELKQEMAEEHGDEEDRKSKMLGCSARSARARNRNSHSRASRDQRNFQKSVYLMLQLAKALTTVSDFECEAIADESVNAHYRLRERWSFMERRTL